MIREIFGREIEMGLNPISLEIESSSLILAEQSEDLVIVLKGECVLCACSQNGFLVDPQKGNSVLCEKKTTFMAAG